jgi:hypothetical protein
MSIWYVSHLIVDSLPVDVIVSVVLVPVTVRHMRHTVDMLYTDDDSLL